MKYTKYFIITDPNTENPNPGDSFIGYGIKYLIKKADPSAVFYDVSAFNMNNKVWSHLYKEADYLIIAGRPRIGLLKDPTYCNYFFWEDIMKAKKKGIPVADLWAGSGYGDVSASFKTMKIAMLESQNVQKVLDYESKIDFVVTRDKLLESVIKIKRKDVITLPCSAFWSPDYLNIISKEKTINAITLRQLPGNEWILQKLLVMYQVLSTDKPTYFLCHQIEEYNWAKENFTLPNMICIYDPRSLLEFYSKVDKLISIRIHGSVPALSLGASVFHIAMDSRSYVLNEFGIKSTSFKDLAKKDISLRFQHSKLNKIEAERKIIDVLKHGFIK